MEKEATNLGYKLGKFLSFLIVGCLSILAIAVTIKLALWIILL